MRVDRLNYSNSKISFNWLTSIMFAHCFYIVGKMKYKSSTTLFNSPLYFVLALLVLSTTACSEKSITGETKLLSSFHGSLTKTSVNKKVNLITTALTTENINDLLHVALRLKEMNTGDLDYRVVIKLLSKSSEMSEVEQEKMLLLLQDNMSPLHLPRIKPMLYSKNEAIAKNAFCLLLELKRTREIQNLYLSLSYRSVSNLVRIEAVEQLPLYLKHDI